MMQVRVGSSRWEKVCMVNIWIVGSIGFIRLCDSVGRRWEKGGWCLVFWVSKWCGLLVFLVFFKCFVIFYQWLQQEVYDGVFVGFDFDCCVYVGDDWQGFVVVFEGVVVGLYEGLVIVGVIVWCEFFVVVQCVGVDDFDVFFQVVVDVVVVVGDFYDCVLVDFDEVNFVRWYVCFDQYGFVQWYDFYDGCVVVYYVIQCCNVDVFDDVMYG